MTRNTKIFSALSLAASLAVGTAFAAGALKLSDEVETSSIKLPRGAESPADFAQYAKVSRQQAEAAALVVQPGQVTRARLDDEDGYLVWQIDVKHARGTTAIAVDAGNGKALAAEKEDDDDHGHGREDRNERS